ncbi:hypothetical protein RvY_04159-1 [Ramazzottius varieornatus]|uniref:Thymidine kinase n=1 Tax=Ramazzottius varieornatus TaxID=947166 RepID=A0A1D1UQK7_RAMVA|nr:hypothetical protein RvY_04159-1 [Ramazzottius varieornatus]
MEDTPSRTGDVRRVHSKGQIQLIFGPMFSGKTTELLRRVNRYRIAKYKTLLIKFAKDVRYDEECVSTHDRHTGTARKALCLKECLAECEVHDVIGIDEGQFFPDILEVAEALANKGKTVIVAALDGTYQREGFGDIIKLVPKAEKIDKLSAVCIICNEDAAYTRRFTAETAVHRPSSCPRETCPLSMSVSGQVSSVDIQADISKFQVELIGGADKYMAVCRECFQREIPAEFGHMTKSQVKEVCSPRKPVPEQENGGETGREPPFVKPMKAF